MKVFNVWCVIIGFFFLIPACASIPDYSGYSTQQLRQELARETQRVNFHVQKVDQRQYQSIYGNEDSGGQGVSASGSLIHALAARSASKRAEAIEQELIKRGEQ